ncbi:alpha/beta fold hydrolase, partial [Streptomyces sp. NPDC004579]|uniref:thioesterase II family protein n=1 Tax=Streptomyces sp. NPDC004579 TaxID=3154667 RepID=UPI0033BB8C61
MPFAGAGPSFFHPWRELSAGRWRVTSVELPGKERRILETPYRNVVEAAENSIDDIVADLGEGARTVLFGHSLGAVLAYELVHLLSAPIRLPWGALSTGRAARPGDARQMSGPRFG